MHQALLGREASPLRPEWPEWPGHNHLPRTVAACAVNKHEIKILLQFCRKVCIATADIRRQTGTGTGNVWAGLERVFSEMG